MGMRKRWSRHITVDGVKYRYHIAEDRHEGLELNIRVQRVDPAGQRLLSGFAKPMPGSNWGQDTAVARSSRMQSPPESSGN
jgi:hypothetical protein